MRNHLICTECKLGDFLIFQCKIEQNEKISQIVVDYL